MGVILSTEPSPGMILKVGSGNFSGEVTPKNHIGKWLGTPPKGNKCSLKNSVWKTSLSFQNGIKRCLSGDTVVHFPGCNPPKPVVFSWDSPNITPQVQLKFVLNPTSARPLLVELLFQCQAIKLPNFQRLGNLTPRCRLEGSGVHVGRCIRGGGKWRRLRSGQFIYGFGIHLGSFVFCLIFLFFRSIYSSFVQRIYENSQTWIKAFSLG